MATWDQNVVAYLELMRMRMPDRLQYALHVDESLRGVRCPPITLLTLVENAVRHGIDPSEEGGRIEVGGRLDGTTVVFAQLSSSPPCLFFAALLYSCTVPGPCSDFKVIVFCADAPLIGGASTDSV